MSERLPIAYLSRLWSKRSTPPIIELYSATAAGQEIIDEIPSLFFYFTEVIWLGLWYVERTVTGFLSCNLIAATHPLVSNMNSPRCIRSLLLRISGSPFLLSSIRTHGIKTPFFQSFQELIWSEKIVECNKSLRVDVSVTQGQHHPLNKRKWRIPLLVTSLWIYIKMANKSTFRFSHAPDLYPRLNGFIVMYCFIDELPVNGTMLSWTAMTLDGITLLSSGCSEHRKPAAICEDGRSQIHPLALPLYFHFNEYFQSVSWTWS